MEKLILSKDLIRRRLKKNNNGIIIFGIVLLFFFGIVLPFFGVFIYWGILIGLLVIGLGVFFRIKDNKSIDNDDFYIILNPVNALDISHNSTTDIPEHDYIYFNFHDICGRYRYCFVPGGKVPDWPKEGDMYYLIFTQKKDELFTSVDCVFPAASTTLDDVLQSKLQADAYLTGYILPKDMELKQKNDIIKDK